jgi:two-component system invasion response regulator UvrY
MATRHQTHNETGISTIQVLIVDDHPVVRDGFRRLLESTGEIKVVAEADSGRAAFEAFKQYQPDVVIMDLVMPGAGGIDAIRRIVQWDRDAQVLVFSMHENPAYVAKAVEAGASGYVCKNRAPGELLESVRQVAQGVCYFALAESQSAFEPSTEQAAINQLTLREFEVFSLLALGQTVQDVASCLNISQNTVGVHQTRIMNKLGVQNAAQLVRLAIRHDIVKP